MALFRSRTIGRKNFAGDIFSRFEGLEPLFEAARGASVLDVGSNEGLISYEFARHGARLVHGFERDRDRVQFSLRLFRDVAIDSHFEVANLAVTGHDFAKGARGQVLLPSYDIVLYLGMYHHLHKQAGKEVADDLVRFLVERAGSWFGTRSPEVELYEPLILEGGFELVGRTEGRSEEEAGPARVYRRS